jgi:protease-4
VAGKGTKRTLLILGIIGVVVALWAGAFAVLSSSGGAGTFPTDYDEEILSEGDSTDKIALINVVGEIFSDPEEAFDGASDTNITSQLDQAMEDEDVVAVILNLDTPGGTVVASDAIHSKVLEVRDQGKPVVALMGDVAASGGYYIAAGADEIVAHPYTWTGSIGVIAMFPNLEQSAGKLGVSVAVFKSGALKDAGSFLRALTDQERALFQALVDEAYAGFVDVVSEGRDLDPARTRELADGRIYSGKQAKEVGLVDHLGDRERALERAKKLSKSPDATLVRYAPTRSFLEELLPFRIKAGQESLLEQIGIRRRPGAAYLWLP